MPAVSRVLVGVFTAALAACGGATDVVQPSAMPHRSNADVDWRDQVIYQIVVDRFYDGDPNNNINVEPSVPGKFHGGDWQGIIDKLDYLQTLGVTALWISPVVKNVEEDAGFHSYHGYWTQDFLRPNAHFGDMAKLRELIDKAHEKNMLVILDVVTNHMGQLFYYDINGNGQPDDSISGGGYGHTCLQIRAQNPSACSADEMEYCTQGKDYLERIIEWDPDYDPRGVQGWTSLGFSGPADVRFTDWPDKNRTPPPRPPDWFGWDDTKPWFDDPSWYNRRGRVYVWWHEADYTTDFVREQETKGDFPGGLKDLNTDNPDTKEALIRAFEYWIDVADFDGFRIDTVKHIDRPEVNRNLRGFWGDFADRMRAKAKSLGKQNFFIFGEAFDGKDDLIGSYTWGGQDTQGKFGRLDSVFYFSQKYRGIDAVFAQGQPTKNLECLYNSRIGRAEATGNWCQTNGYPAGPDYQPTPHASSADGGIGLPPTQVLVNFLDNHDLPRFMFEKDDPNILKVALAYLMTWDGIPCVYYGTEQGFAGGVDPKNREDMFRGNEALNLAPFATDHELFQYVQGLIQMRKDNVALRRGQVAPVWSTTQNTGPDAGIFAFERSAPGDQTLLVVINTSTQTSHTCAGASNCLKTSLSGTLTDVMPGANGATFSTSGGQIDVTVPPRSARVLVKK